MTCDQIPALGSRMRKFHGNDLSGGHIYRSGLEETDHTKFSCTLRSPRKYQSRGSWRSEEFLQTCQSSGEVASPTTNGVPLSRRNVPIGHKKEDWGKFGFSVYKFLFVIRGDFITDRRGVNTGHPSSITIMVGATCRVLLTLLLLPLTGRLCDAEELTHITGIQGGSVFLLPLVPPGFTPREVFWRHLSPIDHIVASFSRGSSDTAYQSCFHGRVKLLQNFTLEILGLELRDTGMFTCQMVDTQGHMKLFGFHLTVYEVAAKPEVQVFVSRQGQDCAIFLSCNVTTGNNVTYSWIVDTGQEGPSNETYRLYDEKRLLKMTLTSTHKEVSFTCVVTNPVSQERTSVVPWTICSAEPGQDFRINNGKIVILIAASLIIMFTTAMICVYFFTRSSGKTPVKGRQRTNIHTEETLLQLDEENDAPENRLTGLQDDEETTAQQNGEMSLGHNTDQDSTEERTVPFSPETIVTHKVETIV